METIDKYCRWIISPETTIISGGAAGADKAAEQLALQFNLKTKIYPADWERLGKQAGYIRNQDIVAASDLLICLYDGSSKGTQHSIDIAKKLKKDTIIVYFVPIIPQRKCFQGL